MINSLHSHCRVQGWKKLVNIFREVMGTGSFILWNAVSATLQLVVNKCAELRSTVDGLLVSDVRVKAENVLKWGYILEPQSIPGPNIFPLNSSLLSQSATGIVSEWVGFNVPINTLQIIFPVNHMHRYWQPNHNNQVTEHTKNIKITQPKKSP